MKRLYSGSIVCILIIMLLLSGTTNPVKAENDTAAEVIQLIDGITVFQQSKTDAVTIQDWLDGDLAANAGISSEWYIIGLRQYQPAATGDSCDFSAYEAALSTYLNSNNNTSSVSRQKYALALLAASGTKQHPFIINTMADSIGRQGLMSWIFGLHLLNNGCSDSPYSATDVIAELLSRQLSDDGWALTGSTSDVDVTAMTIQALAPYYSTDKSVQTAVDQALDLLAARQLPAGDYASFGVNNPESTAQIIIALSALDIDLQTDSRFIKNGRTLLDGLLQYRLPDGSFCHTAGGTFNATATAQSYLALVALWRMQNGYSSIYEFDFATASNTPTTSAQTDNQSATNTASDTNSAITAAPDPAATGETKAASGQKSYKIWACLIIVVLALTCCLILWLMKKNHPKNYLLVIILAAAAVLLVLFTNIQNPEQYYKAASTPPTDGKGTVTLTIRCDTIVGQTATTQQQNNTADIPDNGVVLPATDFVINQNDTVYDILIKAAQKYSIHVENSGSGLGLTYISGINYLYEFDYGDLSGWVYHVNGSSPAVNCSDYILHDGDQIEWLYTCAAGNDL